MKTRFAVWLIAAVLLAGTQALAHHSFSAFNTETEKTITGTVNRFEWTNVGSSRVDLQACKLEYSIVSPK